WGTRTGSNPTHSQSLLYFVVSLEPRSFYVSLAGIAAVIAGFGPRLGGLAGRFVLALGCVLLVIAVAMSKPDVISAFQARGGAAVAAFLLEFFLLWRWVARRRSAARFDRGEARRRRVEQVVVAVSVGYVAAMTLVNVAAVRNWSRSLDA